MLFLILQCFPVILKDMKNLIKNFAIILIVFLVLSGIFTLFSSPFEEKTEMSLSQVVEKINEGGIKNIVVSGNELEITLQEDKKAFSNKETESALSESLINYGVDQEKLKLVEVKTKEKGDIWNWLMPLLLTLMLLT